MRCCQDQSLRGWNRDRFVSHVEHDFNFFGSTSSETQYALLNVNCVQFAADQGGMGIFAER